MQIPTSLRKTATEKQYQLDKQSGNTIPLLEEPAILERYGWRLIANRYPYDAVFEKHDMLIPIDGVGEFDGDFYNLLNELSPEYDFWFVNFRHRQSIKDLVHVHLVKHKPREEMSL